MRSSIACTRCRRSKVKCVNNGVGTVCRSCEHSGRDCQYPPPVTAGSRRREGSISGKQDGLPDGERRPRPRKSTAHTFAGAGAAGSRESPRPVLDALESTLLTPTVWSELFDIFQLHYSADLPFLHPPTFLKPLRQATMQPPGSAVSASEGANARPPGPEDFLLAFLALTARFHPRIVAHHSPPTSSRPSNPLIASEYYASAANERSLSLWPENESGAHRIESIQAALMLGLHEWGMCRGFKAWTRVGLAIRCAQAMGLQYEKDLDDEPNSRSMALKSEAERMGLGGHDRRPSHSAAASEENAFIEQEIRRRTFWSCYVMDRYLSSGKYRPQMLHARELRIQLPASERSFLFAEKVRTLMLGEQDRNAASRAEVQSHRQAAMEYGGRAAESGVDRSINGVNGCVGDEGEGRLETGADEGLVSRYIKVLEIYGKVVQWSCSGGRRVEEFPPWDQRSEFQRLLRLCHNFKASLPRQHLLTPQNTQAHISMKTQTPYTLVHTVYLLCQIMLHREYVPFIPIRCKKPEGPLDPPLFPPDQYNVPSGFWEDSARQLFQAARSVMDLVRTCQEWNALVETPIVGFAIYTVAFVGVYCMNFPHMDPDAFMCKPGARNSTAPESPGSEAALKAVEMIGQMGNRMHMAAGWFGTIYRMHRYFTRIKRDYAKNVQRNESIASESEGSPTSSRQLSLREGGIGGGLDEFKLLERTLQEFGNLDDRDIEMVDASSGPKPGDALDDDDSGTTVKSEEGDRAVQPEPAKQEGPWNAINATPGAGRQTPVATPTTNGQFRSYASYQQPVAAGQPPHAYTQSHPNGFRPAYGPQDGSAPLTGPTPSMTSPTSRTTSTPSHPSPPFDPQQQQQQQHTYGQWTPQHAHYPMQPPPPAPPSYGSAPIYSHHHPQSMTPISQMHGYPTPATLGQPAPQPSPQHIPGAQQGWDSVAAEKWYNSIDTRLGGDDVTVFVEGGDPAHWASAAAKNGYGGWLGAIFQPHAGGAY